MNTKRRQGFTLVELLISITIIAILAVGLIVAVNPLEQIRKSTDATNIAIVNQLRDALERYGVYAASTGLTSRLPGTWLTGASNLPNGASYLATDTRIDTFTILENENVIKSSWYDNAKASGALSSIVISVEATSNTVNVCVRPQSNQYLSKGGLYGTTNNRPAMATNGYKGNLGGGMGFTTLTLTGSVPAYLSGTNTADCQTAGTVNREYCAYCASMTYE